MGHATGRAGRIAFGGLLERILPASARIPLEDVREVRRVLLVRPNFRLGNTLMTNAIVRGLRERFPQARLEYLAGDATLPLLENLPIDAVHPMSRSYVSRPWEFFSLFRKIRRERFDLAVEAGMGSFSGGLYAYLSGARWRIGFEGSGERFLNVLFPRPICQHAYDDALEIGAALGMPVSDRPVYEVAEHERSVALEILGELDLRDGPQAKPLIGVFVGGHLHKRWPNERWLRFLEALDANDFPYVVFLGPEERAFEATLRAAVGPTGRVLAPRPLRIFAALVERCALLVTPDSGPMHLAVALGVPTIALLQSEKSSFYAPRGPHDRSAVGPDVDAAVAMVRSHPVARRLLAEGASLGHSLT